MLMNFTLKNTITLKIVAVYRITRNNKNNEIMDTSWTDLYEDLQKKDLVDVILHYTFFITHR